MNIQHSDIVCRGNVVKKIFGGGSSQKQREPARDLKAEADLKRREKEQDARERDLKKQERARKAVVAAAQRGSRLLLYDDERGVSRKVGQGTRT